MLVLSRKVGQKIVIGDNIVVTVVRVEGTKVRLGVKAPREIRVMRSELCEFDEWDFEPQIDATTQPPPPVNAASEEGFEEPWQGKRSTINLSDYVAKRRSLNGVTQ